MALKTHGTMAVDWEQRIDFDRLRKERLARAKALLAKSEMGALLCFDMNNVRYITATHIGTWAQDKISRFTLLPQNDEPILWDFGSAARHHQLNCPWLGERSRPGISLLRGAMSPEMGRAEDVARKIKIELEMRGLHKQPVGIDVVEPPILFALQREGITVVDGQQLMSDARVIKTQDEISLLNTSAMMVDAAYEERERSRRAREQGAVRSGLGVRRGCERHFRRTMQPASTRIFRSSPAPRRSRLLRHPALLHGISHMLLPDVRGRLWISRIGRRVSALPRLSGRCDLFDPPRTYDC
jgi:Xaa-Pro aminopeptidase